jgi:hypothetical protein
MTTSDGWAGTRGGYQPLQSATSPGGVPANPFSRTLASMEPQEKDSGEGRTPAGRPALGTNRASLDVESFKNLLLTGKPGPRPLGQPMQTTTQPNVSGGPQFESSSSTDTSSISRQSLIEPSHQTRAESPRTSFEIAESDEEETMGAASEVKKGKRKPPPAPKPRHGKPVSQRQPQTVSFESFSASQPPLPPVARSRKNSDVIKPLPPTPVVLPPPQQTSGQEDTSQQRPMPVQPSSESLATAEAPRPLKKTPPPVPLARRQSQLRSSTVGNRSRSNSSLTMSSQHSVENYLSSPAPSNKDPQSIAKSPPPPPRSRHGARLSDINTSDANSSSTELPQRSGSIRTTTPGYDSRRSTLDSESPSPAADLRRTSSIASNRPSQRVVSNESTGSATMPPPPPPPRRRSNRSSLDQQRPQHIPSSPTDSRRTSLENRRTSLENNRRTSVASESSLRREYAPVDEKAGSEYALYSPLEESEKRLGKSEAVMGERSGSGNILDDMEKFQREIEELRLRYTKKD